MRGYSRWYGVDRLTAVLELQKLGVPNLQEREQQCRKEAEHRAQANARRKAQREQENEEPLFYEDDTFAYIAGHTSGGAPFGVTHEEWNQTETGAKTPQPRQIYDDELPF